MPTDRPIVIVTGATRGLGLSIAQRLVGAGYFVVGTGRRLSDELRALTETSEGNLAFELLDLADSTQPHAFMKRVHDTYGTPYGLINNAAVAHDGVLATMHERQITETITVNVTNTILLTKFAVRFMLLRRGGRIVNMASILACTGFSGLSVYGATKAALVGFTKSLARELGGSQITVNTLAPGYMATQMSQGLAENQLESIVRRTPLGRLATTDDVAGSVLFLLGKDAAMITGTVLTVDGGSTA